MKNKKFIYLGIIIVIITLGFVFRLDAYLNLRPLWHDEILLFFNIYRKNFLGFFSVLDFGQSAPPIFLSIEKLFISVFGYKEMSIRFFSLLCSFVSLPIFYLFSKSLLSKPFSIIIANFLFSVNLYIIFYSQELKQYSLDVLSFMVLFLFLKNLSIKNFNVKKSIKYILVTAIFPFLSLISYLPIAAWSIREILINRIQLNNIKKLFIINLPLIILSGYYYIAMLRPQRAEILRVSEMFWQQGFLSFNIKNNLNVIYNFFLYVFEPCNHSILLSLLFITGICIFLKNYKKSEYSFLLIILTDVLFLSLFQIYPIYQRASLYIIPAVIVSISKCFDVSHIKFLNKVYLFVIMILFLISFSKYDNEYIMARLKGEVKTYYDARTMMNILKNQYKPDEAVVISAHSWPEYDYNKMYFNFKPKKEIYTIWRKNVTQKDLEDELNEIIKVNRNCWFFYSIDYSKGEIINNTLKNWKNNYKILYDESLLFHTHLLHIENPNVSK